MLLVFVCIKDYLFSDMRLQDAMLSTLSWKRQHVFVTYMLLCGFLSYMQVSITDPNSVPLVTEMSFGAASGFETDMVITKTEVTHCLMHLYYHFKCY